MTFGELLDKAVSLFLGQTRNKEFKLESEKDIQALVFHHAVVLAQQVGLPLKIHAEPTRIDRKPDLVLGEDEAFVEIKLSKSGTGGYTQALVKWREDIDKLRAYKANWLNARCIFFAVDESGYHSSPNSKSFFDPQVLSLRGTWTQLGPDSYYLLAEI